MQSHSSLYRLPTIDMNENAIADIGRLHSIEIALPCQREAASRFLTLT